MKVKTVIRFRDKKENVIREVGEEFTVSQTRFKEILKVGPFIEAVTEEKKTAKKAEKAE